MLKKHFRIVVYILLITYFVNTSLFLNTYKVSGEGTNRIDVGFAYGTGPNSYKNYSEKYRDIETATSEIILDLKNFESSSEDFTVYEDFEGREGISIYTPTEGEITFEFQVMEEGKYGMQLEYFTIQGKGSSIIRSLSIDGQNPFDEASNLYFSRCFIDEGTFDTDVFGNQIRPSQIEKPTWLKTQVKDHIGFYPKPFEIYLEKGIHSITLESIREPMVIGEISFRSPDEEISYDQYLEKNTNLDNDSEDGIFVKIEGEDAIYKSDNMMYPITDFSSPDTSPSSHNRIMLNTIGGAKWQNSGQWLEWSFKIPSDGMYQLGLRVRQNIIAGQPSYRKIIIDDKVLFDEMNKVSFPYSTQWDMFLPGDEGNPYLIYLTEGNHTIRMEVILGDIAPVIQELSILMSNLNAIAMDILMLTGPNPDVNRDYLFHRIIPDQLVQLSTISSKLEEISKEIAILNKGHSAQSQQLLTLAKLIKKMTDNPDRIPKLFYEFRVNVSSLGTLITSMKWQPLELDYMYFASPDVTYSGEKSNWMQKILFSAKQFIASFVIDYNNIGATSLESEAVTVWISSGRDQANALSQMSKNYFTSQKDIAVNLQLVPLGTLLSATMANKGPDVALSNTQSDPLNYAIRGAVQDLNQFEDFETVKMRFRDSAMEALTFRGKTYGLPETQNFPMLFYRKDILSRLNLEIPRTWNDVIAMLPDLQKKYLNFGLPQPYIQQMVGAGYGAFALFLFQEGGDIYNEEGNATQLKTKEAQYAFNRWVKFYNDYTLPHQYDFITRFRTGEIPIGIADYSLYNILSVFAPELEGLWGFSTIPGTIRSDGTINNIAPTTVTATVLMSAAKNSANSWEFIKWWTSFETQELYGNELESIMGVAGRYQTANIEALYQLPWKTKDFEILMEQWEKTKGIREVPGSYMTSRYIDFAFKQAFYLTTDPDETRNSGEVLLNATILIESEINKKLKEFDLD